MTTAASETVVFGTEDQIALYLFQGALVVTTRSASQRIGSPIVSVYRPQNLVDTLKQAGPDPLDFILGGVWGRTYTEDEGVVLALFPDVPVNVHLAADDVQRLVSYLEALPAMKASPSEFKNFQDKLLELETSLLRETLLTDNSWFRLRLRGTAEATHLALKVLLDDMGSGQVAPIPIWPPTFETPKA